MKTAGFQRPAISWKVAGQSISGRSGTVQVTIDGRAHGLGYVIDPVSGELTLSCGASEACEVSVTVTASEASSGSTSDSSTFTAAGVIDGYRPGDLESIVRCLVNNIPREVDWNHFKVPGHEPQFDELETWRRRAIEKAGAIPQLKRTVRQSLERLVDLQISEPGVRPALARLIDRRGPR